MCMNVKILPLCGLLCSCEGGGVFPIHAMLNHSCCEANAIVASIHGDHRIAVIATAEIEAGQEVTIDYFIGLTDPKQRQQRMADYLILPS